MILRARTVVTMDGPPLEDGAVAVEGNRIAAVGPFRAIRREHAGEVTDLGEQTLLPGLINAHCHLDYTRLRHAIPPGESFTRWISQINALKRAMGPDDYLRSIAEGFWELKRWGTTTVCNLEAFPELLPRMPPPPLRTWWFLELLDIRSETAAEALVAGALAAFKGREGWLGGVALHPHAPYTASPGLYRRCGEEARRLGIPVGTHLAESRDEAAMFHHGRGELFDFLKSIGRPMGDCGEHPPFSNAIHGGLVGPGWLLAHANELEEADFDLLAALPHPERWQIVHCPRSHAFFGHRPFPWRRLQALGIGVSLGTDSLASNESLDLFAEMRAAQKSAPWLTSESLMETVTVQPARALNKSGELGVIAPGALADLIALPFTAPTHEIYNALVANPHPIEWMMLDGNSGPWD